MQFGHLGIALAIASLDPRPETFAVVGAAQLLPNADSLAIRAGWAKPDFHGTWSHSLAFCGIVGAAAVALLGRWLGGLALASGVAHVASGVPLAEAVRYSVVEWAAARPSLAGLWPRPSVRSSLAAFLRAPFWTTALVIFSPIPDSVVRILAPLGGYPMARFLGAIALGRFPRLLLIAGFGVLVPIPTPVLLVASIAILAVGVGGRGRRFHSRARCGAPSSGCS